MYVANLVLDNQGGAIHGVFLLTTRILIAVPLVAILLLLSIASSYGSQAQVDKNTLWSVTRESDPNFKS